MKKLNFALLFAALISVGGGKSYAHDIAVANADGVTIYYKFIYINDKTELAVTYQGSSIYSADYADKVVIPDSVTYEDNTYSVTSIGDRAFYRCISLTAVTIPNSMISISNNAFEYCSGLTAVSIPNSVTSIGIGAFEYCSGLTAVTIPNSVTSIGIGAFAGCSGLEKITVESGNPNYDSRENCNAIIETKSNELIIGCKNTQIPNSVTSIGEYAFSNCSSLTELIIPSSVTSIGKDAFRDCSGLTELIISNGVTSIDEYAFQNCSGLTELTIPNNVTSIGNYVFQGCSGLEKIVVESGNPNYDSRENCNAIIETKSNELITGCKNTQIPNSVTSIGKSAFYGCSGLTELTIPNSVTYIGSDAFWDCSGLTELTIPNSVTYIGGTAFYSCSGLTELTIPNSVTSIGSNAFRRCSSLTAVTIPNSVTSIDGGTFSYCSSLTELTIPNSVTSIGKDAFQNCSNLTELTIPNSVTSIGSNAFYGCRKLTTLYSLNPIPPAIFTGTFDTNHYTNVDVFVPEKALETYQTADVWKDFKKLNAIDNTAVTEVNAAEQIQTANGQIVVTGLTDGTTVAVYDLGGQQVGQTVSKGGQATVNTGLTSGAVVVKVGERSVKVTMK